MSQASKRSIKFPAPPKQLTEEEKQQQQARFFMQKREAFAEGILFNLCQNPQAMATPPEMLVDKAVKMGDLLMKRVYLEPLPDPDTIGK